jgi:hypothetical protein
MEFPFFMNVMFAKLKVSCNLNNTVIWKHIIPGTTWHVVSFELGFVSVDIISSGIKYNCDAYYKAFI